MIGAERLAAILAVSLALSCASGPRARVVTATDEGRLDAALAAYEDLAASDGDDVGLLAELTAAMLEEAACDADPEVAALAVRELAASGTAGRRRLADVARRSCTGSFDATVYLARRGDEASRRYLRGLSDSTEPRVRTAVVIALSPEEDRALLLAWAQDEDDAVRAASAERLGALGPDDGEALALLTELVRSDGNAPVRARAARALGSYDAAAFEPLRERLSDPEGSVRMSAIEALARADRERARGTLLDLLQAGVNADTLEAARVLASVPTETAGASDRAAAMAHLFSGLAAPTPELRAQAAVALVGTPGEDDALEPLRAALAREADGTAMLSIGRALLRRQEREPAALAALRQLVGAAGMTAVQAAVELSEEDDVVGLETLRAMAHGGSEPSVRAVAIHALGRRHPAELVALLHDEDVAVRLAAAGAITASIR